MNKAEQIVNFYKDHPKFPFFNWYTDYDEYCAMYLCITNILKSYISEKNYSKWEIACGYVDFRRDSDSGIVSFPLSCLNTELECVLFLSIPTIQDIQDYNNFDFYVNVGQDDRWGGRWEYNAPREEWFTEVVITFFLESKESLRKLDILLTTVIENKQSFEVIKALQKSLN
ncbi:hypothetical protein [Acinetobacter sp. MD2(2019)]|uniref:hypothetical protein n=1 Tax=Acinetobacter sp. MD2(2019) TaxID=2605273 RepID=UPI002D1E59D6|nr:hypothetical protein [Acinetobacter sp. MD2(2019)]MEB3754859.1 hypothetical protein [Acinetobacter sp. MD2(2019)]